MAQQINSSASDSMSTIVQKVNNVLSSIDGGSATTNSKLKILIIGNSFSCDSFSYLPFILKEGYNIDIALSVLHYPSATTADHAQYYNTSRNTLFSIDTSATTYSWTSNTCSAHTAVTSKTWDLIVLQQGSAASYTLSNYTTSVKSLIASIQADCNYQVKFGWNINHIGRTHFTPSDKSNWQNVLDCCKIQPASVVLPYGTAVFDAMDVFSSKGGSYGYMTYDEAGHLYEGLPCYLAAIAIAQTIFDTYYPSLHLSVIGDTYVPNMSKRLIRATGHGDGSPLEMTANERLICQAAAVVANRDKFNVNPVQ